MAFMRCCSIDLFLADLIYLKQRKRKQFTVSIVIQLFENGSECRIALINIVSRDVIKPTKWLCAQRRLRSAWASAQSDKSIRSPHEETLGP